MKNYYQDNKITTLAILEEMEQWTGLYDKDMSTVQASLLLDRIMTAVKEDLIPGLRNGVELNHFDKQVIYREVEKDYKREDMENILEDLYGYSDEQIDNLNPDFVESVLEYYQEVESNDDNWRSLMSSAISLALEAFKSKNISIVKEEL